MNTLVICIHVIVCFVLIIVILLQAGRGQGLTGGSFGGGSVQSLLGTKASSFLTKATSICAILFLFTCIGLNILEIQKSQSLFKSPKSQVPLDVEQIKKTLEKMKKSEKTGATAATQTAATAAKANAGSADEAAKTGATNVVETLKKEAAIPATATAKKP